MVELGQGRVLMTKTIDVATSHTPLSELAALAMNGTDVILADGETPLVRLVPVKRQRTAGLHEGEMVMSDDFTAPLPDEFWVGQ